MSYYLEKNEFIGADKNKYYITSMMKLVDDFNSLGIKENFYSDEVYQATKDLFPKLKLLHDGMSNFTEILKKNTNYIKIATVEEKAEYFFTYDNFLLSAELCNVDSKYKMVEFTTLLMFMLEELQIALDKIFKSEEKITSEEFEKLTEYHKQYSIILEIAEDFLYYTRANHEFCMILNQEFEELVNNNNEYDKNDILNVSNPIWDL